MYSLFENPVMKQPLAARMRPEKLGDYVGQSHLLGEGKPLQQMLRKGQCHAMILWGPPGVGKTTLAHLIAKQCQAQVYALSAVDASVKEIRSLVQQAKNSPVRTLLFLDEIHRFSKTQQDQLLPPLEEGTLLFIGATTENPSFALNHALLSRVRVYLLQELTQQELLTLVDVCLQAKHGLSGTSMQLSQSVRERLCALAAGDARCLFNILECLANAMTNEEDTQHQVSVELLEQIAGEATMHYDKQGSRFYDLLSAFHKSVRGSSADAALYWYARIVVAGGDSVCVARRLLAIASEDIGNADPKAMQVALNAWDCWHRVGPAEGERAIAQAIIYHALAPKSNATYLAWQKALADARSADLDIPMHLRNAPTQLLKEIGASKGYRYAHDEP